MISSIVHWGAWDYNFCVQKNVIKLKTDKCHVMAYWPLDLKPRIAGLIIVALSTMSGGLSTYSWTYESYSRLWSSKGIRIGQFGQPSLWNIKNLTTWRTREPSYLTQPLLRQLPEGVFSTARVATRTSQGKGTSRGSLLNESPSTSETSESSLPQQQQEQQKKLATIAEEEDKHRWNWCSTQCFSHLSHIALVTPVYTTLQLYVVPTWINYKDCNGRWRA